MEVSQQIIQVLDAISDKFGLAVDWSQNNILPYIRQLGEKVVKYEISTSIVWIVIGLIGIALGIRLLICDKKKDKYDAMKGMFTWVGVFIIFIFLIIIIIEVFDIVACYAFPEKVWIEYVQGTMNSMK